MPPLAGSWIRMEQSSRVQYSGGHSEPKQAQESDLFLSGRKGHTKPKVGEGRSEAVTETFRRTLWAAEPTRQALAVSTPCAPGVQPGPRAAGSPPATAG